MTISSPYQTPAEFKAKLDEEFRDVLAHPNSPRHLANFAMTAAHLADWVWELKRDLVPDHAGYGNRLKAMQRYFAKHWPEFNTMLALCNGSKHATAKGASTSRRYGFGPGFSDGFDPGALQVEHDGVVTDFPELARRSMAYWDGIFG